MNPPEKKVHLYIGFGFKCGNVMFRNQLHTTDPQYVTCKKCLTSIEASKRAKNKHGG
jgi:hypothetical protein